MKYFKVSLVLMDSRIHIFSFLKTSFNKQISRLHTIIFAGYFLLFLIDMHKWATVPLHSFHHGWLCFLRRHISFFYKWHLKASFALCLYYRMLTCTLKHPDRNDSNFVAFFPFLYSRFYSYKKCKGCYCVFSIRKVQFHQMLWFPYYCMYHFRLNVIFTKKNNFVLLPA